jgi:hypothetical protein
MEVHYGDNWPSDFNITLFFIIIILCCCRCNIYGLIVFYENIITIIVILCIYIKKTLFYAIGIEYFQERDIYQKSMYIYY